MFKHQILEKIKKRDNGETVINLFPVILTTIIILALVVVFTTWISNIKTKDDVDQVIRKYTLKIETTGYLTDDMRISLLKELDEAGMYDVKLNNVIQDGKSYDTTTDPDATSYGDQIYLAIEGKVRGSTPKIATLSESNSLSLFMKVLYGDGYINYSVVKGSTSKR